MAYVVGKIHGKSWNQAINVLLTSDKKILADDADKMFLEGVSELKLLNKTSYNELILAQEDTVCFHIVEEMKTKANKYGYVSQAWMKLSIFFEPNTGASKSRLRKKFSKYELYYVTINPK